MQIAHSVRARAVRRLPGVLQRLRAARGVFARDAGGAAAGRREPGDLVRLRVDRRRASCSRSSTVGPAAQQAIAGESAAGRPAVIYETSWLAIGVFFAFVAVTLGSEHLSRQEGQVVGRLLRGPRADSLVRQRRGLRRRLSLGRVVPRHLRHDRLLRLRRLSVFDRLPGRLDRRAVRRRRADEAAGQVHVRRRAQRPASTRAASSWPPASARWP